MGRRATFSIYHPRRTNFQYIVDPNTSGLILKDEVLSNQLFNQRMGQSPASLFFEFLKPRYCRIYVSVFRVKMILLYFDIQHETEEWTVAVPH